MSDNKHQADSMCRVYREEDSIPGRSLGTHIPSVLVFSAARELFSNPSTLIDNPVERADLDRTTDEDFLPRGTGFCGGSLCSGERNNFYLMLKNVLQDIAVPLRYIIHYISSRKIERKNIPFGLSPQIIVVIIVI